MDDSWSCAQGQGLCPGDGVLPLSFVYVVVLGHLDSN